MHTSAIGRRLARLLGRRKLPGLIHRGLGRFIIMDLHRSAAAGRQNARHAHHRACKKKRRDHKLRPALNRFRSALSDKAPDAHLHLWITGYASSVRRKAFAITFPSVG